ncbi:MAG: type II toxin-antitoxin system PemK/MazF family toxin [Defluviitaleaceae bacterium]|nr:type II toxin-antitoxin system PemK/MazF family toxin [Defluviitaleaceae bacterium]
MVKQGDIIWIDFDPQIGTEQKGLRPAIVVSGDNFHVPSPRLALVCPITRTNKHLPIGIPLDNRTLTDGVVLCDQLRVVDLVARGFRFIETAPYDILENVLDVVIDSFADPIRVCE